MPDYDFHQLSSADLEVLARDLLQASWGVTIENFKTGRDGGIDLRYAQGSNKTIVQVKHYAGTGLAGLLRVLAAEAAKVRRLKPTRYVVVTSVPLSPANKDSIITAMGLAPAILKTADILGADDINNLLSQHPEIEGKHFKLWLASRAVLDRVLNNAAITKSEFKASQVYQQAKRYVQTDAFPAALKMLQQERVIIIAGPPGVGKTTLADLLLYAHLDNGYQAAVILRDVLEGEQLFQPGINQIFYFDDFMGTTFAGDRQTSSGATDRAILNFIAMVRATPRARLIMTTREHVYSQAMERSERLRQAGLEDFRIFLHLSSYTYIERARILYNHLYFSDLPFAYRDELLKDDFYLKIVKHEKFNPRLIEWLSTYRRLRHTPVKEYKSFIDGLLHDPSEIWRHAYEQELSEAGRSLLLALRSLDGKSDVRILSNAFSILHPLRAAHYNFSTRPEDFHVGLREIANSFVKAAGVRAIEVIDPSVLDLMNSVLRTAPNNAVDIIAGAADFEQIENIWKFANGSANAGVMTALKHHTDRFISNVAHLGLQSGLVNLGGSVIGFRAPTYERRLAVVIDMAGQLPGESIADLIMPMMNGLSEQWRTRMVDINDGVEILRVIDDTISLPQDIIDHVRMHVENAVLGEARTGCRADELREILSVIDLTVPKSRARLSARESFARFREHHFSDDLHNCRSPEEFDGLMEDLTLFSDKLGVDVTQLLASVGEAKAEFEEQQEAYGDHMQDEWKEKHRFERNADRDVSDLFSTLREDRG